MVSAPGWVKVEAGIGEGAVPVDDVASPPRAIQSGEPRSREVVARRPPRGGRAQPSGSEGRGRIRICEDLAETPPRGGSSFSSAAALKLSCGEAPSRHAPYCAGA